MSAIAPLVIYDGQPTPVAHTFDPIAAGAVAKWEERISGLPASGYPTISFGSVHKGPLGKRRLVVDVPVMEESAGANPAGYTAPPKVAFSLRFDGAFICPERATEDQKRDAVRYVRNLLDDPLVVEAIISGHVPY